MSEGSTSSHVLHLLVVVEVCSGNTTLGRLLGTAGLINIIQ